ncbi:MAG: hypothetical protein AB7V48_04045 [Sedimentibacter sp.]
MRTDDNDISIVTYDEIKHYEIQKGFDIFAPFPYDEKKRFEMLRQEIMPHTVYKSEKHAGKFQKKCISTDVIE